MHVPPYTLPAINSRFSLHITLPQSHTILRSHRHELNEKAPQCPVNFLTLHFKGHSKSSADTTAVSYTATTLGRCRLCMDCSGNIDAWKVHVAAAVAVLSVVIRCISCSHNCLYRTLSRGVVPVIPGSIWSVVTSTAITSGRLGQRRATPREPALCAWRWAAQVSLCSTWYFSLN